MLKHVLDSPDTSGVCVKISEAEFPSPFPAGLEYGAPARGTWNIVHIGMLIPGSHQIFICSANCLRGVILTAAEMNAADRFSMITLKENNILDGDMEELIIEGITDILGRLHYKPSAVLPFTSCVHHFVGCDLQMCYDELRKRFPDIDFTDCYMNPIMRKSGLTPDQIMRKQLYSLLKPAEKDSRSVNIIGNVFTTDDDSDIVQLIKKSGYKLREITRCNTYAEYQEMSQSFLNIVYNPNALAGGESLREKLGQELLYLPLSYDYDEIRDSMKSLAEKLGAKYDGNAEVEAAAEAAMENALKIIGNHPIAIDYTATTRPLGLARLLIEHGFNVVRVYADAFNAEDRPDFFKLKEIAPQLEIFATNQVKMRVLPRFSSDKTLAIGQKAAYFMGSRNFVNIVEGGGFYGFRGIVKLAELMIDAFENEKDTFSLIQQKGLGCECCI